MQTLSKALKTAKSRKLRAVFPETFDPRIRDAIKIIKEDHIASPIYLDDFPATDEMVGLICTNRPKISPNSAVRMLKKPLLFSCL